MNIFITHELPADAAKYLFAKDLKRARKMLIESVQIASYAISKLYNVDPFYKMQGNKAPVFWAMQNINNLYWLIAYISELNTILVQNGSVVADRKHGMPFLAASLNRWINEVTPFNLAMAILDRKRPEFACVCERSCMIRYENNCTVFEAYQKLIEEKTEKKAGGEK